MTETQFLDNFADCTAHQKLILGVLALAGEPFGRTRLREHLEALGEFDGDDALVQAMAKLQACGLVIQQASRGSIIAPEAAWPALDALLRGSRFNELREVYEAVNPLRRDWQGHPVLRSYRQGLALLRMALVGGEGVKTVAPPASAMRSRDRPWR